VIGLAADENLDNDIVRALRRRVPDVDIIRAQDAGLSGRDDPTILLPKFCPTPLARHGFTGTSGESAFIEFRLRSASLARKAAHRLKVSPTPFGGFESRPLRRDNDRLEAVGQLSGQNYGSELATVAETRAAIASLMHPSVMRDPDLAFAREFTCVNPKLAQ
jgi:hypothetical protein